MSYRTHCDWCGTHLAYEDDQAVMPVTIYHRRGKAVLDAKWSEETGVTRHFCAPKKGEGPSGADRDDTCYDRAVAAVKGTVLSDPGMGMEWRVMPIAEPPPAEPAPRIPAPRLVDAADTVAFEGEQVTRELHDIITRRLPSNKRAVLPRVGIVSLDQVAAMTDGELLAIDGIGRRTLAALRTAVDERADYDGVTLARQVYELLLAGLPRLDEEDPMHPVLAEAMPPLAAALGQACEEG